jgi:hypothetical protein
VALAAITAAAATAAGPVQATTGISTGLPEPDVHVRPVDGEPFEGRYVLSEIPREAKITAGQVVIQYTETARPYLVGFAEFDGFDKEGRRSLWMANLYPFTYEGHRLAADVLSQGSNTRLGRFVVRDKATDSRLEGRLTVGTKTYDVAFREVDEETNYAGKLPKAKLTSGGLASPLKSTGWGKQSTFLGRYRQVEDASAPSAGAGPFAPLVRVARALSGEVVQPLSSSLTMISYQAQPRDDPAPAGILKVHDPDSTDLVYLTDLRSEGKERTAKARGGNYNGPVLGTFEGTADGDRLTGTLSLGTGETALELERFSSDPHP